MSLYYEDPICVQCKNEFPRNPYAPKQKKYCSSICRGESKKKALVEKLCPFCEQTYEKLPYQAKLSRYCSQGCYFRTKKMNLVFEELICKGCGDTFFFRKTPTNPVRTYCSIGCKIQSHQKESGHEQK